MTDKKTKEPKKRGRPTKYNIELAKEICLAISSSELGLIHIVNENPHWPDRATIFKWLTLHKEFSDMYARAKEQQCEVVVEYMQEVMNEPHKVEDPETGISRVDVPLLRLKMDTMKWHAAKLKPKKFGEAKDQEPPNTELNEDCKKRYEDMDKRNKKEF